MTAALVVLAIVLTGGSGLPAVLLSRREGERASAALMAAGAAAGIVGAALTLWSGPSETAARWSVPGGELSLRLDQLAAMFLVQIFLVAALGSVYGLGYWPEREHREDGRKLRVFYGLATGAMALLVSARNAVLFLTGWEVMALAAFILVSTEDREPAVRESGRVYLFATRSGTLCLFAFFALLGSVNGSLDLVAPPIDAASPLAAALLVLALLGFGLKAGAMPLHLWLPGAHANAPSHVSALMSGVLIKMGIYGLMRFVSFFPAPPAWWGALVLALGAASGVLGVAFAIGQHDLKRLLAYHSVENIGIILMGLGIGLLGRTYADGPVFALGVGGALLHTWNHGLFKALLFLSAGSVVHAAHTRDIDQLGGLARRMPWTAAAFVAGAVAICGLPTLNGFVSELFVYLAFLRASTREPSALWAAGAFAAATLAVIGGLALACFVKVVGAAFLGEPRTAHATAARESGAAMLAPMAVLAACCAAIGLGPRLVAPVLDGALSNWPAGLAAPPLASLAPLSALSVLGVILLVAAGVGLGAARRRQGDASAVTWDCGYAAPSARMQYTSSSFAELLVGLFGGLLQRERHAPRVTGLFPAPSRFASHVPEIVLDRAVIPLVRRGARALAWFRWVQQGSVQLYLLYVLAALVLSLLVWR
jgi:hydrogenase-4 component B